MRKIALAIIVALLAPAALFASDPQARRKFSPREFAQKREKFIAEKAGLTDSEATALFPLMREMGRKRMEIDRKVGTLMRRGKTEDIGEKEAQEILAEIDKLQLEKVKLENKYHQKYRKAIPATKVMRVFRADWQFSRKVLKQMANNPHKPGKQRR